MENDMGNHTKSHKIIKFPDRKARQRILLENEDPRVRAAATLRIACGWLLIAGIALFALTNYRLFTPAELKNMAHFAVSGFKEYEGFISTIDYENGTFADAELFADGLAYADSDSLFVAKPGSKASLHLPLGYSSPVVETVDNFILSYDRGGNMASLANGTKRLCTLTSNAPIINGAISPDGHFAIITAEQGYKTVISVYNKKGNLAFRFATSEQYMVSTAFSPNSKILAFTGFRQDGAGIVSTASFYSMVTCSLVSECDIPDTLAMELSPISNDKFAALCDNGLYLVGPASKPQHTLSFSADDLLAFSASGSSIAFALRSYNGNARSEIYAMRSNQELTGPTGFDGEPSSVSVSDSGTAVLSASGVYVYDRDFTPLWKNPDAVGARRIVLVYDNSILALYNKHATRISSRSSKSVDLEDKSTGSDANE